MKKALLAAVAAFAFTGIASAQSSQTLDLTGVVAEQAAVSLIGVSSTVSVGNGTSQHNLGQMVVECNVANGVTVLVESANDFALKSADGAEVPYYIDTAASARIGRSSGGFYPTTTFTIDCPDGLTTALGFNPNTATSGGALGGVELTDTITFTVSANASSS